MHRPLKLSIPFLLLASLVSAATVKLGNTIIIGEDITTKGVEFFGGIPFADPPVGNLRLRPPVLKTFPDTPTFNATTFGAGCLQAPLADIPVSEDCLTINIIRPAGIDGADASLPIMAYVFGGGFLVDAPPQLNGSAIVARSVARGTPVIYVSFNYRLGPLGFPIGAEAAEKGALNLGLRDQLAALEWVQQNIAAFGGDKDKVPYLSRRTGLELSFTPANIIGDPLWFQRWLDRNLDAFFELESRELCQGRGMSLLNVPLSLMLAVLSTPHFPQILESGIAGTISIFNATHRQDDWDNFIAALPECKNAAPENTFDCLRKDDINSTHLLEAITASLSKAAEQYSFVPTLDGPDGLLADIPSEMLKKGQYSKIPFIAGNVLDEGPILTGPTNIADEKTLREALIRNFTVSPSGSSSPELDSAVDTILRHYPDIPALGCPFNTGNETFGLSTTYKRVEMNYVFGFANLPSSFVPSPSAAMFSEQIIDYWVSFTTSLDPNDGLGSERPIWPQYTVEAPLLLQLNGSNTAPLLDEYRKEQFEFVDSNSVIFRH
uniref:Carboxylesterase type B domain-containing protein n=1 Tax=Moniliophthora roreri TaxID=221103 RepID=A0A0W0GDA0_MONRR